MIYTFTYKNSWFQVYLPTVDGSEIPKFFCQPFAICSEEAEPQVQRVGKMQ